MDQNPRTWTSVAEYAAKKGVSTRTVQVWLERDTLPDDIVSAERVGPRGQWRLTVRDWQTEDAMDGRR